MINNPNIEDTLAAIDREILNGENHDKREFVRKLLNYPAMMVPSVQESIIKALLKSLPEEKSILDPFMGAANTLVAGMKYGFNVFGQDINPLSLLISQVKTTNYDYDHLKNSFENIKNNIDIDVNSSVDVNFKNIDKWFKKEVQIELSKIRRSILKENDIKVRKFFWVTLAEVIRVTSNDRTSTFKMHIRTSEEILNRKISPIKVFLNVCDKSIEDINDFRNTLKQSNLLINGNYSKKAEVKWGNSMNEIQTESKFQLLLTSPPYGDNHTTVTYGQFSYLPLQWIPVEEIDSNITIDYLKVINEIDSNSLGGRISESHKELEERLFTKSKTLKAYFDSSSNDEKIKARKILNFTNDLDKTIDTINSKLDDNAYQVWTIGNRFVNNREVMNDVILSELLEYKNINLVSNLTRDILSKRMPGRNNFSSTMNKEKILIFKKNS